MNSLLPLLESTPGAQETTWQGAMVALLIAFVLGQVIAWIYSWTHSGLSYSRSFTQSLVLMSTIVALLMVVIGDSIVTAFGLLGALALIRFRNVLKDTRDTVFVFMALVVGMAVGTGRHGLAVVGTLALVLIVVYLDSTAFGTLSRFDGYLTLRLGRGAEESDDYHKLMRKFCRAVKEVSTRQTADELDAEFVYQIGLRDRNRGRELLDALRDADGVRHASLVLRNELSEV